MLSSGRYFGKDRITVASPGQITRLKRNESVSTHTIEMFWKILHCEVEDIMKFIPDEET